MRHRGGGHGEVDHHVGGADRGGGIGHDLDALDAAMAGADARDLAGLAAEHVAAGAFEAPARLQPSVRAISRISIWPMRPAAPAMAIFMCFLTISLAID